MRIREMLILAAAVLPVPAQASEYRSFQPAYFQAVRAKNMPVIIFVHAAWCPVCKAQEATIKKLLATPRYKSVSVLTIDYDTRKAEWQKFGARQQSTIIGYRGRRETGRIAYDSDPAHVEAVLASTLG